MAYGLPIVTTNASSIPEMMEHQIHGLLYRTGDSDALFHAVQWALHHPAQMQAMATRSQQQAQTFSQDSMIEKTVSVLQRLALMQVDNYQTAISKVSN